MAIRTYGIDVDDVLPHLPVDSATIGDLTEPLNLPDLERYIKNAAVEITAALLSNGFDPDSLGNETTEMVQIAIVHGAVARAIAHMGHAGPQYELHNTEWQRLRDTIAKLPSSLSDFGPRVRHNIDLTTTKPASLFKGTGYKF